MSDKQEVSVLDIIQHIENSTANLKSDENNNTIIDTQTEYYLSLDRNGFADEKEESRFIRAVERLVRASPEYRDWVSFVKHTLNYDYCFFTHETDEETDDIEIHHHPLTLYDIVRCVILKRVFDGKSFNSFDIAKEVIQLHYQLKVGFIPLLKSLHKKFHNGYLKIPIELVKGNWKYIVENYPLPPEVEDKLREYTSITLENYQNQIRWKKDSYPGLQNVDVKVVDSNDG